MKPSIYKAIPFVVLLLLCATLVRSQDQPVRHEGLEPYVPSRLEWLAMELNVDSAVQFSTESGYSMRFMALHKEDAILIYVRFMPTVDRQVMNMNIEEARRFIASSSKQRGWSSWLKVKEDVQMWEKKKN